MMVTAIVDHGALAAELQQARLERRVVPTLTGRDPEFSQADAYAVQAGGIAQRLAAGERIVGGKLGFTSRAMQQAMGVESPNYGWLTDAMLLIGSDVNLDELIHPKVEPEIAFTLGSDLGADASAADVLAATASIHACLEIVDSRFENFVFKPNDNIADNSSAGQVILGPAVELGDVELAMCGVVLFVDDEVADTAAGAAALDHPAAAVAWMARAVAATDRSLQAGDIVISGGLTSPVDLVPGRRVRVEIDRIGSADLEVRR